MSIFSFDEEEYKMFRFFVILLVLSNSILADVIFADPVRERDELDSLTVLKVLKSEQLAGLPANTIVDLLYDLSTSVSHQAPSMDTTDKFSLVILHTNDRLGYLTDLFDTSSSAVHRPIIIAHLAQKIRDRFQRDSKVKVLLLDAGNAIGPNPLSADTASPGAGTRAIKSLEWAGYDAMAMAVHEFDYENFPWLTKMESKLSVLSANVHVTEAPLKDRTVSLKPSKTITLDGIPDGKIVIVGVTTSDTTIILESRRKGLKFTNPLKALEELLDSLKNKNPKPVVIVLGKLDHTTESRLVSEFPDVHVIVGGVGHYERKSPDRIEGQSFLMDGTPILSAKPYCLSLGFCHLTFEKSATSNSESVFKITRGFFASIPIVEDMADTASLDPQLKKANHYLNEWTQDFREERNLPFTIAKDTISDAGVVAEIIRQRRGAQVSLLNKEALGMTVPWNAEDQTYLIKKGDNITPAHLKVMFPFPDKLMTLMLSGEKLKAVLGRSQRSEKSPAELVYAGVEWDKGKTMWLVNNRPLKDDETYKVVTNNFLASGGAGYSRLRSKVLKGPDVRNEIKEFLTSDHAYQRYDSKRSFGEGFVKINYTFAGSFLRNQSWNHDSYSGTVLPWKQEYQLTFREYMLTGDFKATYVRCKNDISLSITDFDYDTRILADSTDVRRDEATLILKYERPRQCGLGFVLISPYAAHQYIPDLSEYFRKPALFGDSRIEIGVFLNDDKEHLRIKSAVVPYRLNKDTDSSHRQYGFLIGLNVKERLPEPLTKLIPIFTLEGATINLSIEFSRYSDERFVIQSADKGISIRIPLLTLIQLYTGFDLRFYYSQAVGKWSYNIRPTLEIKYEGISRIFK
jgi:2',3'-cyclic-nucleotide 2'-phosphodiesterase (5'-nucleotidase family)